MDCVVNPFDHVFPVAAEEVKTTVPPEQNDVGPLAVIVGVIPVEEIDTTVGAEVAVQLPLVTVTV